MTTPDWPTEAACFNWLVQVEVKHLEIVLLGTYCPDVCIVERANETFLAHADLEVFGSSSEIWEAVPDLLAEVCSVIRTEQAGFKWINLGTELHQRKSDGSVLVHQQMVLETARFAGPHTYHLSQRLTHSQLPFRGMSKYRNSRYHCSDSSSIGSILK